MISFEIKFDSFISFEIKFDLFVSFEMKFELFISFEMTFDLFISFQMTFDLFISFQMTFDLFITVEMISFEMKFGRDESIYSSHFLGWEIPKLTRQIHVGVAVCVAACCSVLQCVKSEIPKLTLHMIIMPNREMSYKKKKNEPSRRGGT